ncbi:DNA-binding response regulator [Paenibacillus odorifer]|jgi:DNA-binding NarL/FixJ family response regulator|uniref:response regulator n=1 Tax=Paenibacillus TaxID=44249 RepID=UPI00096DD7AB|nr:response regulator transcription factor [Paenibacillus odorifer]OMD91089.1 DNA-binding response regulator [Paenibacillus odorifer]
MSKIKIVIADDQLLTREGLRTILDLEDDMEVVGAAKNGEEACEMVEALQPDLVLLDIQMPVMDGLSALKRIKQIRPNIFILILTTFIETDYIVEGMAYGASGYMLKDMDADKMIASIHDTLSGQFILPAPVAAKLASRMNRLTEDYEHWQRSDLDRISLTEREEELAQLIIRGMNNREIADTLHIAEGTARNYISNLYSKLEVVDRAQAIVRLQAIL